MIPGVYSGEVDLTGVTTTTPSGPSAGIVGTAQSGPAFVPVVVGSVGDFNRVFGEPASTDFGALAGQQYFANAASPSSVTFLRTLGVGNGQQRSTATGQVTNAGFVVGSKQVQSNGVVGRNVDAVDLGVPGRTYFLGCYMSESAGSTIFSDAGVQTTSTSQPILRAVLLAPSGVTLTLSGNFNASNAPASTAATAGGPNGALTGSVNMTDSTFVMLLNGYTGTANVITASFDPANPNHFSQNASINTDPTQIEAKGHYLYAYYDVPPALAVVTGSGLLDETSARIYANLEDAAFLTTGSLARDTSSSTVPNYENFSDRYTHPKTPFVISQGFGGIKYDLFRIHTVGDGAYNNTRFVFEIRNIVPGADDESYGTFDLVLYSYPVGGVFNLTPVAGVDFSGLTLDPNSSNYIALRIGDQNTYFDFDKGLTSQKIVTDGDYPVLNPYIRVEMSDAFLAGEVPVAALPVGHHGYGHLVTSGSLLLTNLTDAAHFAAGQTDVLTRAVEPPIPYRRNISNGGIADSTLSWGIQFTDVPGVSDFNSTTAKMPYIDSHTKYFPSFAPSNMNFYVENNPGVATSNGNVLDVDIFNNNFFSLERIKVVTGSTAINNRADSSEWVNSSYVRNGNIVINDAAKTRAFQVDDLRETGNRTYAKFQFIAQGGFDGVNIFNADKTNFSNDAVKREIDDTAGQGGTSGPTVAAYRKAVSIMGSKDDADINLLTVPGIRHSSVTDYTISAVENRFDCLYLMDIEERNAFNVVLTGSYDGSEVSISNTINAFSNRGLNSSFAAAYFPDINIPVGSTTQRVPPSVGVLGAFAYNDRVSYPWFAPAGSNRGVITTVGSAATQIKQGTLADSIYDAHINPILDITSSSDRKLVIYGQRTLLAKASALDRVNVRRLLITLRRQVRAVSNQIIFEPNTAATLERFNSLVNPILASIRAKGGLDRYKVVIDSTTTTQADIENNTIRGKIFIQPTRSIEFIALSFELSNAGVTLT
jgi:phage tail sheath protein FI